MSSGFDLSFLVPAFRKQRPEADIRLGEQLGALADIEVAVCWNPPPGSLARLPNLKLIQSIAAGVRHILRTRSCRLECRSAASSTPG